ncbi:jg15580 [Pararge aegeria aegeria]|uniref:Jg15580 protein n=1 Tax=Pararge aegeria aegeria TaxID=348720 RepID=A0A8S4RWL4_9NEOP|nr:jg15580 [Pararge aegeria aegeria]
MQKIIIISAILAIAAAAPGNLAYNTYVPLSKSTLTSSSQTVDHGSTHVLHTPVVPLAKSTLTHSTQTVDHGSTHVLHTPLYMTHEVEYHVPLAKTTSTKSSQYINHGSLSPVVHSYSPLLVHSAPVVSYKAPTSAITHHSSTVHETLPVLNSLSYYALH